MASGVSSTHSTVFAIKSASLESADMDADVAVRWRTRDPRSETPGPCAPFRTNYWKDRMTIADPSYQQATSSF